MVQNSVLRKEYKEILRLRSFVRHEIDEALKELLLCPTMDGGFTYRLRLVRTLRYSMHDYMGPYKLVSDVHNGWAYDKVDKTWDR
jgi:hypothetical protein